MSKRSHPVDAIEDLWTLFECPDCGVLFFSEERVYEHLKEIHNDPDPYKKQIFSMEFIRAIPQDEKSGSHE